MPKPGPTKASPHPPLRTYDGKVIREGMTVWTLSQRAYDVESPISHDVTKVDAERRYATLRLRFGFERVWSPVVGARLPVAREHALRSALVFSSEAAARRVLRDRLRLRLKSLNASVVSARKTISNSTAEIKRINRRVAGWSGRVPGWTA